MLGITAYVLYHYICNQGTKEKKERLAMRTQQEKLKDFMKVIELESTKEKVTVLNGTRYVERVLHKDRYGRLYVKFDNDLHAVKEYNGYYTLKGAFSWYN